MAQIQQFNEIVKIIQGQIIQKQEMSESRMCSDIFHLASSCQVDCCVWRVLQHNNKTYLLLKKYSVEAIIDLQYLL